MTGSQSLRVLMVEDTPDDAELNELELRRNGFTVRSARVDTLEGMTHALNEQVWDVVLTDHSMPRLSSLEVLQLLQERSCALPCIVVSGAIGEEAAVELMRSGAADYVNKSFLTRLAPAVTRALREEALKQDRRKAEEALRHAYDELERRVEERTAALSATNSRLRESEKRFSTAFHASPSPTLIAKLSSSQIVDVNKSFLRVTRYELEEVVGRTFEELGLFFDLQERMRKSKRLSDESLIPAVELGLRTKWGEPRHVLVSSALINLGGEPCVLDTFVDITERKKAEDFLRTYQNLLTQQNAKLEQANSLKSEFLASVSTRVADTVDRYFGLFRSP
jgi:PAS domain S-box-containing protein